MRPDRFFHRNLPNRPRWFRRALLRVAWRGRPCGMDRQVADCFGDWLADAEGAPDRSSQAGRQRRSRGRGDPGTPSGQAECLRDRRPEIDGTELRGCCRPTILRGGSLEESGWAFAGAGRGSTICYREYPPLPRWWCLHFWTRGFGASALQFHST